MVKLYRDYVFEKISPYRRELEQSRGYQPSIHQRKCIEGKAGAGACYKTTAQQRYEYDAGNYHRKPAQAAAVIRSFDINKPGYEVEEIEVTEEDIESMEPVPEEKEVEEETIPDDAIDLDVGAVTGDMEINEEPEENMDL